MAVLHHKEEKIQAVLGRLNKNYSPDDFVAMFIKLYSKDWGKIKSAYIKASQDKEPGTVIHMPKPDLYLKQVLEIFLTQQPATKEKTPEVEIEVSKAKTTKTVKSKAAVKKDTIKEPSLIVKELAVSIKKPAPKKASATSTTKEIETTDKPIAKTTKTKVPAKKATETVAPVKKIKTPAKKKSEE